MQLVRAVEPARRRGWHAAVIAVTVVEFLLLGMTLRATVAAPRGPRLVVAAPVCRLGPIQATVARAVAADWLTAAEEIGHSARIVPTLSGGFKLYAIRPDSPLAMIGLRNGDVIRRIAGVDVSRPNSDGVLLERVRAAGADGITIDLERQGCPLTITVRAG